MIRNLLLATTLTVAASMATAQGHAPDSIETVEIQGSTYEQHTWDLPGTDCRTVASVNSDWNVLAEQVDGFVFTVAPNDPPRAIINHTQPDENGEIQTIPTHTSHWWQASGGMVCKTQEWFLIKEAQPGELL